MKKGGVYLTTFLKYSRYISVIVVFRMKYFAFLISLFLSIQCYNAQGVDEKGRVKVIGETAETPGYILNDVVITADNSEYIKKYRSAKYFVRRIYSYADLASKMLNEYQDSLATMTSKRKQKSYLRKMNKELKAEFGDEIKEMSVTRGEYLNKLIYRNTGLSTYDIIKDYRGGIKAVFWQSICRLNGQNLKTTYVADGDDQVIEQVIREIEEGKIKVIPRSAKSEKGKDLIKKNKKRKKKYMHKAKRDGEVAKH